MIFEIVGWIAVLLIVLVFGSIAYGYSLPDPLSWHMDPDQMAEYDRMAGLDDQPN